MTRDEIDELIEYLEENYHVKCEYIEPADEFHIGKFVVTPNLPLAFALRDKFDKNNILNAVKDLIRF